MNLRSIISSLNSMSVNNYIDDYHSYIVRAVAENDIKSIDLLLERGANPNGITSSGLTTRTPLTVVDFNDSLFHLIVRMLLKKGADINQEDLRGHTILTMYFIFMFESSNYQNQKFIDILLFLLERGSNPDGTIFFNPLTIMVNRLSKIKSTYHHIVYKISEILISYGANPKFTSIKLDTYNSNIRSSATQCLDKYGKTSENYKLLNRLFNIDVETIVKNCTSQPLLRSLSKFYKIPYDDTDISAKKLCTCIKFINKNKQEYEEDKFIELRKKIREFKNLHFANEDLIIGSSTDSFPPSELIYLEEKNPNLTFCFHVSEIPMLLASQKNPFNNRLLDSVFINDLVTKYKYFIPKTLEESLDELFNFNNTIIDNKVLLEKLSIYIKTFNSYIQPDKIDDLGVNDLIELQNMLYNGNQRVLLSRINPLDRSHKPGESITNRRKRLVERTLTHLLSYIQNNKKSLPFISNVIDQLLNYSKTAREIMRLFPEHKIPTIMNIIKNGDYNYFLNQFQYIIKDQNDLHAIVNDSKFRNYLSEDQLVTINFLDASDIIALYKNYIKTSIEDILNEKFSQISFLHAWNDIAPALLRYSKT